MVLGVTQVVVRLLRDKIWSVFNHGVALVNAVYGSFVYKYPVSKKELTSSLKEVHKELLHRGADTNERVQDKAEDTLLALLQNEKVVVVTLFFSFLVCVCNWVAGRACQFFYLSITCFCRQTLFSVLDRQNKPRNFYI